MEVVVPLKSTGILKPDFPNKGATSGQTSFSTPPPARTLLNFPAVLASVGRVRCLIKKSKPFRALA